MLEAVEKSAIDRARMASAATFTWPAKRQTTKSTDDKKAGAWFSVLDQS
jgi:hypothetical protein